MATIGADQERRPTVCGRFTMLTWDEVEKAANAILCAAPFNVDPDWPARRPDAVPGTEVRVVVMGGSQGAESEVPIETADFIWGFPMAGSAKTAFNTRAESAATSPFWNDSLASRRCIVPVAAFFEPHREEKALKPATNERPARTVKQTYRFASKDGSCILLAGIWMAGRLSILTTEPDEAVSPVHDRMPLALSCEQALPWIEDADFALAKVSSLRRTEPSGETPFVATPVYPPAAESAQLSLF